jgi:DNA gyrase subunit A
VVTSLPTRRHVEAGVAERLAYLRPAAARRRNGAEEAEPSEDAEEQAPDVALSPERVAEIEAAEEILLTVTDGGFGKRTSAYDYRVTGRGGQGIGNIVLAPRNGRAVVASFPVRPGDDLMLVTDVGRLIRVPVDQLRITGRQVMGVTLFKLAAGERVTSVFPVLEAAGDDAAGEGAAGEEAADDSDS